jgi:hypothetical protein
VVTIHIMDGIALTTTIALITTDMVMDTMDMDTGEDTTMGIIMDTGMVIMMDTGDLLPTIIMDTTTMVTVYTTGSVTILVEQMVEAIALQ